MKRQHPSRGAAMVLPTLLLAGGVLLAPASAWAYSITATAVLSPSGNSEDAKTCRKAPNQSASATQQYAKKKDCTHAACTSVKNQARANLVARQAGIYSVCTKYISTTPPCKEDCS
jgi:uncharacterized protein (UPF0333 family)